MALSGPGLNRIPPDNQVMPPTTSKTTAEATKPAAEKNPGDRIALTCLACS